MPSRKWGEDPEEAGIPPHLEKGWYLPETVHCVYGKYHKKAYEGGEREGQHVAHLRCGYLPSAYEPKDKGKFPRRSPAARPGDAFRVSVKCVKSYAEVLKAVKAKVNPQHSGAEVLSIRRTTKQEILLFLKKGGDVWAFEKVLDRAVGEEADVKYLISKRSLVVGDLDETVTREEVVATLCIALGKPDLGHQSRLYKRFVGVQTAVVRLPRWTLRTCSDSIG